MFGKRPNAEQRLIEREECILRMNDGCQSTKTRSGLVQQRRQQQYNEGTSKFGEQFLGIHRQELPKYLDSEESKKWWKHQKGHTSSPRYQSQLLLRQSHKFWAKADPILNNSVSREQAPPDPFKTVHVTSSRKEKEQSV